MAAFTTVSITCPECGDDIPVPVMTSTSIVDDALLVRIASDSDVLAEHYVKCRASDDLGADGGD